MCGHARAPQALDFPTDKMDNPEGRGVAAGRWGGFHSSLPEDVIAEAFSGSAQSTDDLDPELRDDIAADAVERYELIGFWVAWHLAGGFTNLERGLAPGHHLPEGPAVPGRLRGPPRRVHVPLVRSRPPSGLDRTARPSTRARPYGRRVRLITHAHSPAVAPSSASRISASRGPRRCSPAAGRQGRGRWSAL